MADNDDRPHHHIAPVVGTSGNVYDVILTDDDCTNPNCTDDIGAIILIPAPEYRALVAAARDRHPAGQQRGPDPASRAFKYCDCALTHDYACQYYPFGGPPDS